MAQLSSRSTAQLAEVVRQGKAGEFERLSDEDWERLIRLKDEDERTLLHTAAATGQFEIVEAFLAHGAEVVVNGSDEDGWTPLMSAASSGHHGVVQRLLDCGAQVDQGNSGKRTALHYAASKGQLRVLQVLLEAGAQTSTATECAQQCLLVPLSLPLCIAQQPGAGPRALRQGEACCRSKGYVPRQPWRYSAASRMQRSSAACGRRTSGRLPRADQHRGQSRRYGAACDRERWPGPTQRADCPCSGAAGCRPRGKKQRRRSAAGAVRRQAACKHSERSRRGGRRYA